MEYLLCMKKGMEAEQQDANIIYKQSIISRKWWKQVYIFL